jgi:hypothetical protein
MNSASLCSMAGLYDNPIPPRFLAPIYFLKIPAQFTLLTVLPLLHSPNASPRAGIFKESMGARSVDTEEEKGYRTGPPGYIGWRNSILGIDSWTP